MSMQFGVIVWMILICMLLLYNKAFVLTINLPHFYLAIFMNDYPKK